MRIVEIFKSQSIGKDEIESLSIVFDEEYPDFPFERQPAIHDREAEKLEYTLVNILPGGIYDRLLTLMLKRKESQLIVKHEVKK